MSKLKGFYEKLKEIDFIIENMPFVFGRKGIIYIEFDEGDIIPLDGINQIKDITDKEIFITSAFNGFCIAIGDLKT